VADQASEISTIRLELFGSKHLAAFAALFDDPDVARFTRLPTSPPPGYPEEWLHFYDEGRLAGTREAFAIVDAATGGFLGIGVAPRIDREARTLELGYVVAAGARGRGTATRALQLLTRWSFDEIGALRSELFISTDNEASKIVAARCGYVREGVLRSAHFKDGVREDTELWSRLPSDP
jgi:RimJ/RimL family protein N-acetyltransferase